MAISIVHLTTKANIGGGGTDTISIPAVGAGNALVIALASDFTGGVLAGLTDSAGDTFTHALAPASSGVSGTADVWFCLSPTAGTNSIVITPGGYSPGIWIYEISSGGQPMLLDDAEQNGTTSAFTTCIGPSVSATSSSDFFLAVCGTTKNVTAVSSAWTLDPLLASPTSGTQAAAHLIGTGTQVATFTQDAAAGYIIVSVSFKIVTGGSASTIQSAFALIPYGASTTTASVTLPSAVTAGDGLVVMVLVQTSPSSSENNPVISDSQGNTYVWVQPEQGNQYANSWLYVGESSENSSLTVTISLNAVQSIVGGTVYVAECSTPFDATALVYGTDTNFANSGIVSVTIDMPASGFVLQAGQAIGHTPSLLSSTTSDLTSRQSGIQGVTDGEFAFDVSDGTWDSGSQTASASYSVVGALNSNACLAVWVLTAQLPPSGCQPATLAMAIVDLCERAGLDASEVDVSLVTNVNVQPVQALRGYVIERPTTAAECLQQIMRAYFIDACETGGKIRFVPRGMVPSPPTIPEIDLGLFEDKAELIEAQAQLEDLPVSTTVLYNDQLVNYEQGKQIKQRNPRILTVATRNQTVLSLPFTLLPDEARQIAEADLYSKWCNRLNYKINLWRASWALLDPCDTVKFVYEGGTFNMRVLSVQVGQNLTAALEGVLEDYRNYLSTVPGSASSGSGTMITDPGSGISTGSGASGVGPPALASTQMWLLDIPYLQDADAKPGSSGFYAVFTSALANWGGATLFESSDDASFTALGGVTIPASYGYPSAALAAPSSPWSWDTVNSLTIQMVNGTLAGSTDANVLAGANGLIVGQEVIQFVNCTDNGGGSFTISRLLRGRRGTDNFCGTHVAGEVAFVPLSGGILSQVEPVSHIGQLWYYRGVTRGGNVASAPDVTLTLAGNDLKPYSVVNIGGSQDTSNNWTISWTRRTRAGGTYGTGADSLIDGMNGPLNEQSEAYQVDVMSGSTVKRTISTNVTTAVYTAAQETADFGSVQTSLTVNIYQMSATVGRGFKATATLPASGAAPASVVSGDVYVN